MTEHRTAAEIAAEILEAEAWFNNLDRSLKDDLSQPNHDWHQAQNAIDLARAVLAPRVTDPVGEQLR